MKNIKKLIIKKYFLLTLNNNLRAYIKTYNIFLTFKTIKPIFHRNFLLHLISTHYFKYFFIDFVTSF